MSKSWQLLYTDSFLFFLTKVIEIIKWVPSPCFFFRYENPILKIRRWHDNLIFYDGNYGRVPIINIKKCQDNFIFIMGIPMLVGQDHLCEMLPGTPFTSMD